MSTHLPPPTGPITVLLLDTEYRDLSIEREAIEDAGGELIVAAPSARTEESVLSIPQLAEAAVLLVELAPVTRRVLQHASSCRAVVRYGTGMDNIDLAAAAELGIRARGVPGYAADSVADHTIALLMALVRRIPEATDVVGRGSWRGDAGLPRPVGLRGSVLGLVGFGAIAQAVATRAKSFGMTVIASDPYVPLPHAEGLGVELVTFTEIFRRSDVVSLHLPLNDATRRIVNSETLSLMKTGSILLNTSRGELVDTEALLAALDADHVSRAGLDVTTAEPPEADCPLRRHSQVLLTPHIGYWSDQSEQVLRESVARIAVEELGSTSPRL